MSHPLYERDGHTLRFEVARANRECEEGFGLRPTYRCPNCDGHRCKGHEGVCCFPQGKPPRPFVAYGPDDDTA
jgi:hypothetical protein